jgi:hypothetical protein
MVYVRIEPYSKQCLIVTVTLGQYIYNDVEIGMSK